ncbi:MAG: NAD(P)-binding domain-containing protein [Bacteroidales bacterium]|nr:NAD(P)-binding domain-containing protein [Bacteroidales bacterium]
MKICLIGAGNLGGAVARGLVRGGVPAECITLTAAHSKSLEKFEAAGFNTTLDNAAAVCGATFVLIAVKPWLIDEIATQIAAELDAETQTLVCLAPGVSAQKLEELFPGKIPIVYAIPNTAAEIGKSATIIAPVRASKAETATVVKLMEHMGSAIVLPAEKMLAGTSVTSCGIAYALRYIRAAVEGAVELGIPPATACKAVCDTVEGAARLLSEKGTHAEEEIDRVTTPGGLTIKGLNAMEESGFSAAVVNGLKAGIK